MHQDRAIVRTHWLSRLFRSVLSAVLLAVGLSGAAAHAGFRKPSVLIVHAAGSSSWVADVQAKLNSSTQFTSVASLDARIGTPSLAQLLPYDAVLLFTDAVFADPVALGNNLADYVDAGGGVVNMAFSTANVSPPAGRWNPGYLSMAAGAGSLPSSPATLDLASITDQNHAILIGVGSFSGGSSSYRAHQNNVVAGATVVARWTGGNVLVSTGPLPGRADLNFFPPSSAVRSDLWNPTTDGVKLMVNSLLYTMRPRVLIAAAEASTTWNDDVKAKIRGTGLIGITDIFRADTGTPTLAQLQAYDAVLVYSDDNFQNPTAMGNVLADYADAGGGVVSAVFATSGFDGNRLTGRWLGTYELISGGSSATLTPATTLGTVTYPSHPAMSGVATFNGGSSSLRTSTSALNPGAFNIAQWSDGRPLVVASTRFFNRVDLGFFPPSSTVRADLWQVGTNGDRLLANALISTAKPYIACVAADPAANDAVAKLAASRRFSGVARIDANAAVPTLATLSPFHAVATWSNSAYANPTAFGDTLADYVDAGGGVVTAPFGVTSFSSPQGRWITDGYEITPSPLPGFITNAGPQSLGQVLEPAHPIASFVRKFDGGFASGRQNATPLLRGRTIMQWTDGKMLTSVHNFKKRADLGYYTVSGAVNADLWNQRTDGTWLTANALEFVVRVKPCPGDFNGDGLVDDTDFQLLVGPYDNLIDPRADLTGDGNTDDADFQVFVQAYNQLLCP